MYLLRLRGLVASGCIAVLLSAYVAMPLGTVFAEGDTSTPPQTAIVDTPLTDPPQPATTNTQPPGADTAQAPITETAPVVDNPQPVAPAPETPGPQTPVGPDASTYIYNPTTGLWENAYYTWDPATKQTKPKDSPDYSYNPATGMWDTSQWIYNPASGKYQENVVSTPTPTLTQDQQQLVDSLPDAQGALLKGLLLPSSIQGPGSSNTTSSSSSSTGFFDLFHNASISNTLSSSATSGDAAVLNNTAGGSAISGNAQAVANLFNSLNSSLGFLGGTNPVFFMANILGNILGDLLINPGQLPNAAGTNSSQLTNNDLKVTSESSGTINNAINLNANSGAATVANNTQAGSATSGNAYAMANVVNAINSAIGSGQSFMGMINIYGNLNGDILLPPGFLNSLLASNAQAPQTNVAVANPPNDAIQKTTTTNADLVVSDTSAVHNNLNVTATSGNALIGNNTSAGDATSGKADTNVTLLNLTGKQIVGKNALLVFVNVLGRWVGLIMNAPTGVTAGLIGDSSASANGALNSAENNAINLASTTNNVINNDISVAAKSGDALVSSNTSAGNATSGDAHAAVNILNITNSDFSLSDWFGILFINVLGNWYGSFGVDTAAGNPINTPSVIPTSANGSPQVFSFVPKIASIHRSTGSNSTDSSQSPSTVVLGNTSNNGNSSHALAAQTIAAKQRGLAIPWLLFASGLILLLLFGDKLKFIFIRTKTA